MSEVRLVARCTRQACAGAVALDPAAVFGRSRDWPVEGAVSDRFRCRCGARTARLGYRPDAGVGTAEGVYLFA